MAAVLDRVTGQPTAVAFLQRAATRPHHAYILAGPEGSGKSLVARAFVASLLVVKPFLAVVQRSGYAPFAWYRIALGLALAGALAAGWM